MDKKKGVAGGNRNVFKGSVLISLLVESHPRHFPSRPVAYRFAQRLFREGHIHSIVGARDFEDSAQLYMWRDEAITQRDHGHVIISALSPSHSNPISSPEKKTHRHLDWQLIEDIRSKLLNRSDAYNIVTSYNTFIQELQQDFGYGPNSVSHKKSPPTATDIVWSSGNTPFTSTLEHKKGAAYSTNSYLEPAKSRNLTEGITRRKSNSKHLSSRPHSKNLSAKGDATPVSHKTSPEINHHQQNSRPRNQRQHHRHHNSKHHHLKTDAGMMNKQSASVNSENSVIPVERLASAVLNPDQPLLSHPSSAVMDYRDGSNRQSASENTENKNTIRNAEPGRDVVGDRRSRRPPEPLSQQLPEAPLEMQTWLNPGVSHFSVNQGWVSENRRSENEGGLVGASCSRWPESVVSDGIDGGRRWPESTYSYSDNEKQLLEEMRRMKTEHQNVLRTYEGRINKLMTKMHELRNIAEMLEHSSNKSSPYGVLPGKLALLNILGRKAADGKNAGADYEASSEADQVPPPLPPRPGRGSRVYPNKPIIHTSVAMKPLFWSRIILENDSRGEQTHTIWQGMTEPKIDTEELQRLFSGSHDFPSEVSLYEDISLRRGRSQSQLVTIYDAERSQRIASELRALHCTLSDVIQAFMTLNCDGIHTDSFAELLELLMSPRELDKISHHVKTRGAGQLDVPEYLVFELSKVDHFRERLEFLRFKNKIQINLFEIDQQLRELQTACQEMTLSTSLKHVLETVLAVGNHMNAGTDRGQADGFTVDILTSLKDMQDLCKQCNLLELIMRMYCLKFESDLDFGCPTRFRLPEPSNMRHAAQVSFEDIQRALKELKDELFIVRNKLESLSKREGSTLTVALKVTSENFMTSAMEALADEQKLLEDTRVQFWKTASYFSFDGQKSTPRDFFQIWASFLHDCKYYWKLAHRNLAKAKFSTDLVTKSQLSCSSLPGFNSLKSAMMKHVASFQQDEEMRSSKSQQLQHISSWIQSVGKYTMEMQPDPADFSLDTNDIVGHHSGALPEHDQRKLQPQQEQDPDEGPSSPPYQNQTVPESRKVVDSMADLGKHFEQRNKMVADSVRTMPSKSSTHIVSEEPQTPSSPKPMKATPPNVIKPQPTVRTFHPTSSDRTLAKSLISCQPTVPEMKDIHRYNSTNHDDADGIEPLYESLSHYSQNFLDLQSKDASTNSPAGMSAFTSPGNTLSPDSDNTQKKNSKFFKSLLKRDQKRPPPVHEDNPRDAHSSPFKSTSTPFSKVKNTFVHKFSASGNSKNSNNDSQKDYNHSNVNLAHEASNKQQPGLSLDDATLPDRETFQFDNARVDATEADHVNYQNLCFPYHTRPTEGLPHTNTSNSLEVYPHHNQHAFYGGHESFPSTVSSLQSIRNKGRSHYQGNILHRQDNTDQQDAFNKTPRQDNHTLYNPISRSQTSNVRGGLASQSGQARVRAPIALGSNMSISDVYGKGTDVYGKGTDVYGKGTDVYGKGTDVNGKGTDVYGKGTDVYGKGADVYGKGTDVYGKGTENAETQTSGNYDYHQTGLNDLNLEKASSSGNAAAMSAVSDPKFVTASTVPVYKAKLIPNYENQSKYDPRFEGAVRGRAEAVVPPVHAPQVSISSDVYRQELQKKSEQYIGGSIAPTSGQTPANNNSLRGSLAAPYSILPSKPNQYHAFPITVPEGVHQISSSPRPFKNISEITQGTSSNQTNKISQGTSSHQIGKISQGTNSNQTNKIKNNPENGEVVLSADYSPQLTRPGNANPQVNLFGSSERKLEIATSCIAIPIGVENDRAVNNEHLSAHRSSSAHTILDRDSEFRRRDMGVHSVNARPESQEHKSHMSRKNVGGRKTTPTSRRDHSEAKSDVPQSVTSLIDKFEKGTDVNNLNIGLLDISDKPPSMTSTPVVRRRNQGVSTTQTSHGKLVVARSDAESGRSLSEGTRRSLFPKEDFISGWQKDARNCESANSNLTSRDQHFSDSCHQMVGTHQFQSQYEEEKDRTWGLPKQLEDYQGQDHRAKKYQQSASRITRQFQQSDQNSSPGAGYVVMFPSNVNQREFSQNELSNRRPDSHPGNTNIDRMLGTASNIHMQSVVFKNSPHYPPNETSDQSSPTKPDPQNVHLSESSKQQQHKQHWSDSTSATHVTSDQPQRQPQVAMSPGYDNLPQQRHHAPVSHSPHITSQGKPSQSYGSMNSTSSSSPQRGRPNEDFHRSSKPSAFEPLARAGPVYGRQPGATAVVKPTVMNI